MRTDERPITRLARRRPQCSLRAASWFATTQAIRIAVGCTNSEPLRFSVPDGTLDSEVYDIEIVPTVTNSPASGFYSDRRSALVFVNDLVPVVTKPLARDPGLTPLPPYTNLPLGQPFVFDFTVKDVPRDQNSIIVAWRFSDGTPDVVVTGNMGTVTHTYATLGVKTVWLQAQDKDTGFSEEIEFPVQVVPPPPPSVRVLPPEGSLMETSAPNSGSLTVQLSEAFTNMVTVGLTVTPAQNAVNGAIVLATNQVFFAVGQTKQTVRFSARNGTDASVNGDGVANGFEYAFGGNLTNGVPLMTVRFIEGVPVVETPTRNPASAFDAFVTKEACTNQPSRQWTLPMGPYTHAAKPSDRDWDAPLTTVPKASFFRLRAVLND